MRRDGLPSPHSIKKIRARETGEWGSFFLSPGKNTPLPKKERKESYGEKGYGKERNRKAEKAL